MKYILVKKEHIPGVKVGDFLSVTIFPDASTTLYNARKVTAIQKNGVIRVECINSECKRKVCTYLRLTQNELNMIKIDNTLTKSQRLGGMTI